MKNNVTSAINGGRIMKRKDILKRLGLGTLAIISALSMVACSSSPSAKNDAVACEAEPSYYYEDASYDYVADEEWSFSGSDYDLYDNAGFGVAKTTSAPGSDGTPITETEANASVAKNRKLIKTVNMELETMAFDEMLASLQAKVSEVGGYIETEYTYNGSSYNKGNTNKYATITVRVPDSQLDAFVGDVSGIGSVISKTTSTNDVTLNYVDTESKKEMYLAEQESLLALLEKAETIEDITYLTERLTQIRYNIESMESTLRVYDDLVDYATVNITINEVKILTPTVVEEKTPMEELKEGFNASVKDIFLDLRNSAINFVIRLPYLIRGLVVLGIIALVIFIAIKIIIRVIKKQKAKYEKQYYDKKNADQAEKEKAEAAKSAANTNTNTANTTANNTTNTENKTANNEAEKKDSTSAK